MCLNITETGATSWILRSIVAGKRRHIGLGPYPEVSLSEARQKAQDMRRKIASGIDPVEERIASRAVQAADEKFTMTFEAAFERFFSEKLEDELQNAKHSKQWRSTLITYAYP